MVVGTSVPCVVSERDHVLDVIRWSMADVPSLTRADVLAFLRRSADTPWEEIPADRLFLNSRQNEYVRRVAGLDRHIIEILSDNLADLKVLRVGRVNIDVYTVGRDHWGAWTGLHTSVPETWDVQARLVVNSWSRLASG